MIVSPTQYLQSKLDPISKAIDGFGGYNLMIGFIAAGGEPHIYITGNLDGQPTLAKEIYEALSDRLRAMGAETRSAAPALASNVILGPGAM